MNRAALFGVALAVACGGKSAPPPPPVQSVPLATPSTAPTCEDMGPLLRRGLTSDGDTDDDDPETKITATCEEQKWTPEMLACVADANENDAPACIEMLPEEQRTALRAQFGSDDDQDDEEFGDGAPEFTCDDLVAESIARWDPPIVDDKPNGLGGKLRLTNLLLDCVEWEEENISCLVGAGGGVNDCLIDLLPDQRDAIKSSLETADELRAKIVAAMKKPATITCAKVATVRYPDAKWKQLRPKESAAQRRKALGAERTRLTKECTTSAWPAEVRACIVVENTDECFELAALDGNQWRISVELDLPAPTGVAECDELIKLVWQFGDCDKLPREVRDQMKESMLTTREGWKILSGDALQGAREACKSGGDAMRQALAGSGC